MWKINTIQTEQNIFFREGKQFGKLFDFSKIYFPWEFPSGFRVRVGRRSWRYQTFMEPAHQPDRPVEVSRRSNGWQVSTHMQRAGCFLLVIALCFFFWTKHWDATRPLLQSYSCLTLRARTTRRCEPSASCKFCTKHPGAARRRRSRRRGIVALDHTDGRSLVVWLPSTHRHTNRQPII